MSQKTTDEILFGIMAELDSRDPEPKQNLQKKIMILSTPRSGSTLFCDTLNRTELLGECREWFNLRYIGAYARIKNVTSINFQEYFDFIVSRTLRGSGTFVVNMHIDQYQSLIQQKLDPLGFSFDHVFYINRKNKLRQAVSLARAWQTDQWGADVKAMKETNEPPNNALISQALFMLLNGEQFYKENLKKLVSLEFDYEIFQDLNNQNGLPKLFDALGVNVDTDYKTEMKQQSDASSEKSVTDFLRYIQGER